jgi:thioredoxin reductase (NADPH)
MESIFDFVIIGGGAAGLTAAQYAGRSNLKTLVIEEKSEGGQAVLIDRLENYPGFSEPISGYDFSSNLKKQAIDFGADFIYGKVSGLDKTEGLFNIAVEKDEGNAIVYRSRTVLLATGADHRKLSVPGENEYYGKGVSYCATCDGPFFRNKHIVVVGGGDAACDEAAFLSRLTDHITMVHRKDRFRAQKAIADRILHDPHITTRFNSVVAEIKGSSGSAGKVTSVVLDNIATGERDELPCDAVFIFVGMNPRTELAALAKQDESGYILTDEDMHTSIHGLFAAGDIRAKSFRQVITAAADGAIAAHNASKCIDEDRCGAYQ